MVLGSRITQIGIGIGAGVLGYAIGASAIGSVRTSDLTAPPTKVISADGKWIEEQKNTPHTDLASFGASAFGGLLAAGGAVLVLGNKAGAAEVGLMRALGGVGLIGLGAGLIGGALATASSTSDIVLRPDRTPTNTGISITPP